MAISEQRAARKLQLESWPKKMKQEKLNETKKMKYNFNGTKHKSLKCLRYCCCCCNSNCCYCCCCFCCCGCCCCCCCCLRCDFSCAAAGYATFLGHTFGRNCFIARRVKVWQLCSSPVLLCVGRGRVFFQTPNAVRIKLHEDLLQIYE